MGNLPIKLLINNGVVLFEDEVLVWLEGKGILRWPVVKGKKVLRYDFEKLGWCVEEFVSLRDFEMRDGVTIRKIEELSEVRLLVMVEAGRVKVFLREWEPIGAWCVRWLEEFYVVEFFGWEELDQMVLGREWFEEVFWVDAVYGVVNLRWFLGKLVRGKLVGKKLSFGIREFFG